MSVAESMGTITARVAAILEDLPEARDDDNFLYASYVDRYTNTPSLIDAMRTGEAPQFESVSRSRRKIQESGRFLGKRRQQRLELAQEFEQWALEFDCTEGD